MGRFYYFDSVCTFSANGTTSFSTSSLQIEDPGYFCGNPEPSAGAIFTINASAKSSNQKSCGLLTAVETNAETQWDSVGGHTYFGGTYSSSRPDVTSPTYSWSDPSTTGTATGGYTMITTALTSVTYSAKETTTATSGTFYFDDASAFYLDTNGTGIPVSVIQSSSIIPTTTQSSYTLTNILTTVLGYHFAFRISNAQAAWYLEPLEPEALSRFSPAFSASSPQPSALSFSASSISGTHSFVAITLGEQTTSGQTSSGTPLQTGGDDDCADGVSLTTQFGYTGPIFSTYETTAATKEDVLILRPYLSLATPRQMPEVGHTGISGRQILAGLSASPYTYSLVPPIVGVSLNSGMIGVSCLNGGTVLAPYWFRGKTTGVVAGSKATLSWLDAFSLAHTRLNGTASTVTATVSGILSFVSTQTDASQVVTASYIADTAFHKPPLQKSSGTSFAAAESYGATSGTYRIISTNSSGFTSSFTTTGTTSRSLNSADWARPIRKEVKTYAYTTSSATITVDQGLAHGLPAFSGYYGSFFNGTGTSQMLAEEFSGFRVERTVSL